MHILYTPAVVNPCPRKMRKAGTYHHHQLAYGSPQADSLPQLMLGGLIYCYIRELAREFCQEFGFFLLQIPVHGICATSLLDWLKYKCLAGVDLHLHVGI